MQQVSHGEITTDTFTNDMWNSQLRIIIFTYVITKLMQKGPHWTTSSSSTPLKYFVPFNCKAPVQNNPIQNPLLRKLNTV